MAINSTYLMILDGEETETSGVVPEDLLNFFTFHSVIQFFDLSIVDG